MAINLGKDLKIKGVANPSQLFSQGESADKLLDKFLKEENIESQKSVVYEELLEQNKSKIFKEFSIKCDDKFSERVAILEIESSDEENIVFRLRNSLYNIENQPDTEPFKPPKISFEKSIETRKLLKIIGIMNMFADENKGAKTLQVWLIKLKEMLKSIKKQENKTKNNSPNNDSDDKGLFYLIINDRSKFEIPWEMLKLNFSINKDDYDYLGSFITTVRWQDMTISRNLVNFDDLIDLELKEKKCCGNFIAYLNTEDLPEVEKEKENIDKFNPSIYKDVYEFFDFLESYNNQISLVFIASHGFLGKDLSEIHMGGEKKQEQIFLTDLYEYDFDFLDNKSTVIFINTCHSGRLHQDDCLNIMPINPKTGKPYPMGFSTFFLKKGAVGVIGTLCKVLDGYAAKVSSNFFTEYQQNPSLSVATILTNLRAKAVKQYKRNKRNRENKLLLISTFMYIYYGNPLAKLNIREGSERMQN